jgi:ketopantoate reductase
MNGLKHERLIEQYVELPQIPQPVHYPLDAYNQDFQFLQSMLSHLSQFVVIRHVLYDVVFLFPKSMQLKEVLDYIQPHITQSTIVVCTMNGIVD